MSHPVDFMSPSVDFVSGPVDFLSLPVDFRSVLSANALMMTLSANHHRIKGYGKTAPNRSAICDRKVAF